MNESATYWSVDEAAECLEGIDDATYGELWSHVPQQGAGPTVAAVWDKLSESAQANLSAAFERNDREYEELRSSF